MTKISASKYSASKKVVVIHGKIFKSERRANFRLLTFPHHQVYLHIQTDDSELHESNVINFQTKVSETGIFKDFLDEIFSFSIAHLWKT